MKRFYANEWGHFKKDYQKPFWMVLALTILFSLSVYFVLILNASIVQSTVKELTAHFANLGIDTDSSLFELFWIILVNNLRVSFFVMLFGFVPIVILPAISPVVTGSTVSILMAFSQSVGENPVPMLLFGILPHGIIEMTAIILCSAIAIYMSVSIVKKMFSRHRNDIVLGQRIKKAFTSYVSIVVPLIIIAAIIEGFITPIFLTFI